MPSHLAVMLSVFTPFCAWERFALRVFLCLYFIRFQTYVIKYATTQPGRAYGGSGGQSEMVLNDCTVITQAPAPIVATSRTFLEADVWNFTLFSFELTVFITGQSRKRGGSYHRGVHSR